MGTGGYFHNCASQNLIPFNGIKFLSSKISGLIKSEIIFSLLEIFDGGKGFFFDCLMVALFESFFF